MLRNCVDWILHDYKSPAADYRALVENMAPSSLVALQVCLRRKLFGAESSACVTAVSGVTVLLVAPAAVIAAPVAGALAFVAGCGSIFVSTCTAGARILSAEQRLLIVNQVMTARHLTETPYGVVSDSVIPVLGAVADTVLSLCLPVAANAATSTAAKGLRVAGAGILGETVIQKGAKLGASAATGVIATTGAKVVNVCARGDQLFGGGK